MRFRLSIGVVLTASFIVAPKNLIAQSVDIEGIIADSSGQAIPFAYISTSFGKSTVSGVDGHFRFREVRVSGSVSISGRRIGYRPANGSYIVDSTHVLSVRLTMAPIAAELSRIEVRDVVGYDEYLDRSGYYRRVAKAIDGTFISREAIDKRNPAELTTMLNNVPGIHVERDYGKRGKASYVLGRGSVCTLGLVIDGQRVETSSPSNESVQARIPAIVGGSRIAATTSKSNSGTALPSIDETLPVNMIAAIEVYPSAVSVPNEFHLLTDACGLIVVWTRYPK